MSYVSTLWRLAIGATEPGPRFGGAREPNSPCQVKPWTWGLVDGCFRRMLPNVRILDVSRPLHPGVSIYAGDPPFCRTETRSPHRGKDDYVLSELQFGAHVGTHVDAPRHMRPLQDARTVDQIPLDELCGPVRVLDCVGALELPAEVFQGQGLEDAARVLIRTDGAPPELPFSPEYPFLSLEAAEYLASLPNLRLVGIDTPSVDRYPDPWPGFGFPAHRALLDSLRPVTILEGLDLRQVSAGIYELWCLPLPILGAEGSPARVVLVER